MPRRRRIARPRHRTPQAPRASVEPYPSLEAAARTLFGDPVDTGTFRLPRGFHIIDPSRDR